MVQCYVDQVTQVLDQHADTFLCGDDAEAKALVTALAGDLGMGAVDVGPLASASLIDALTRMWGQIRLLAAKDVASPSRCSRAKHNASRPLRGLE